MNPIKNILKKLAGKPQTFCTAVIVAAGEAKRMEGIDKILHPLDDCPVLLYSLKLFQASPLIDEIIIVTREDLMVPVGTLCHQNQITKVRHVLQGGPTRSASVLAGVQMASPNADIIAIHDGARPFVTDKILTETIAMARARGAAAPAIAVKDTVKIAQNGVVQQTPDRAELFAIQTPQIFEASLIKAALHKAIKDRLPITDDCSAVEAIGFPVCLTQGSETNLKITTPRDLLFAKAILSEGEPS